jgi:hypothetical protein
LTPCQELATVLWTTFCIAQSGDEATRSAYCTATNLTILEILKKISGNPQRIMENGEKKAAELTSKYTHEKELLDWSNKAKAINDLIESLKAEDDLGDGRHRNSTPGSGTESGGFTHNTGRNTRSGTNRKRKELEEDLIKSALELGQMAKKAKDGKRISLGPVKPE